MENCLKKKPVNSDQHCFVAMYAVFWLLFLHVKVFFFELRLTVSLCFV